MVIHKDGVAIRDWKWYHNNNNNNNNRHVPLHRISLPAIWNDKETFAARRWEWFLDHGCARFAPIHKVYEGDEDLSDPWKKNEEEAEAARPKDVNDVLIQMVRIAEHLKRRGHAVKSWSDVRLRIRDAHLRTAPRMTWIEAKLVVKQAEVLSEMNSGLENRFLSPRRLKINKYNVHYAKELVECSACLPLCTGQSGEALAAMIKIRRTKVNKSHRDGSSKSLDENNLECFFSKWERAREEAPNGFMQYQLGRLLRETLYTWEQ